MERSILKHIAYLITALLFTSCEKVIQLDLNSADPKLVIEGNITDQPGPYTVKLTQTINFDQDNTFPPISGASVKISDNAGNTETLAESTPGIYVTSTLTGIPGRVYTLEIIANDKTYTAISSMPSPVVIDTLVTITQSGGGGLGGGGGNTANKYVEAKFTDPAEIANYYRFILYIQNEEQNAIILDNDETKNGQVAKRSVRAGRSAASLKVGDSVKVHMQSIDNNVYEYFRTLNQMGGGNGITGGSAPANPLTNISGGALGYFNACSVRTKSIKVQ